MHKMARVLTTLYLMVGLNVTASAKEPVPSSASPGVTAAELSYQNPVHWVSIAQIENSLQGKAPMAVGFDIDDTVLFSSPGFYHGKNTFSPDSRDYLNNPEYWEKMNNGWDQFSLPKKVGNELIAMHLKRGDAIFFITARMATKTETLTKTLQDNLHIPQALMNPIIFAGGAVGQNSKAQWLQEKQIKIYYGDADQDILAARAAGARGIRILRAANSNEQPLPKAGAMGEEVVVNSEY